MGNALYRVGDSGVGSVSHRGDVAPMKFYRRTWFLAALLLASLLLCVGCAGAVSPEQAAAMVAVLDTNQDGIVSREELRAAPQSVEAWQLLAIALGGLVAGAGAETVRRKAAKPKAAS